jgi:hypothetical protein
MIFRTAASTVAFGHEDQPGGGKESQVPHQHDDPRVKAALVTCGDTTARQRLARVHRVTTDGRAAANIAAEVISLAAWTVS